MECVLFMGLQGAGKSTFYRRRFFETHLRLNLDMLRTRHRERELLRACLETGTSFVVDNTNPTREDRQRYIPAAREHGATVIGYFFESDLDACRARNAARQDKSPIPLPGLRGTLKKLAAPDPEEGFDELHAVRIAEDGSFVVEAWDG